MSDQLALLHLLQVASATFPTGAFSHSLGFETLIFEETVIDATSLEEAALLWLRFGLAPLDGGAVALSHAAAGDCDLELLAGVDETVDCLKLPRESREASLKTGEAFLRTAESVFSGSCQNRYRAAVDEGACRGHGAVAFGVVLADGGVSAEESVLAFLQSSFSNLISVAARLIPLGQVDVQRIINRARTPLIECTALALLLRLTDLASSTAFLDVASMRHERLYTRLCIS